MGAAASREMARDLQRAGDLVQSSEEELILQRLRSAGAAMRDAASAPVFTAAAADADRAAEELVGINVRQAHGAEREVEAHTSRGQLWAALVAVALALGVVVVLAWTRAQLLMPLQSLRGQIQDVALGGAPPPLHTAGPIEIRELASTLGTMAAAVDRRRHERLELLGHVAASMSQPLDSIARLVDASDQTNCREGSPLALELVRLRRVLDEYMDAAHIDEGVLELHTAEFDLAALVRETIDLFRSLSPAHSFVLKESADSAQIRGDERRLAQVFNHLLFIAIRHAALGGLIEVALRPQGEQETITIEISPTGSASFERLFNALHGLEAAFLGVPGSGFTIHTARRLVSAHGGTLDVRRQGSTGVEFTVSLPRVQPGRELLTD